jgi:hypothetical protein
MSGPRHQDVHREAWPTSTSGVLDDEEFEEQKQRTLAQG